MACKWKLQRSEKRAKLNFIDFIFDALLFSNDYKILFYKLSAMHLYTM